MGAASGRRANRVVDRQGLAEGPKPGNRGPSCRPAASAARIIDGRNGTRVQSGGKRRDDPRRGERSEGENPKSAAGAKQNRPGIEGSKPSGGYPNPEGGTWRAGMPA